MHSAVPPYGLPDALSEAYTTKGERLKLELLSEVERRLYYLITYAKTGAA